MKQEDEVLKYMSMAISQAIKASNINEVPVGAIVIQDHKVIGHGFNRVIQRKSVSAHAEIEAINSASRFLDNYRLNGCDLFVTLEPCHMCAKAIVDARIKGLYFGAYEPKSGAIESIDNFFNRGDLNHKVSSSGGHMKEQCALLLKDFFQLRRG